MDFLRRGTSRGVNLGLSLLDRASEGVDYVAQGCYVLMVRHAGHEIIHHEMPIGPPGSHTKEALVAELQPHIPGIAHKVAPGTTLQVELAHKSVRRQSREKMRPELMTFEVILMGNHVILA